jgi:hypothetical protein
VLVRERISGGYLGILDNDPDAIAGKDEFSSGIELPFGPHQAINIENAISFATQESRGRWPRV